jgi:ribosome-binding factor A
MPARRADRVAELVRHEVARRLREDVDDPIVAEIGLTEVRVNDALTVATLRYLPLGGRGDRAAIAAALQEWATKWRGPIARALRTRHAIELRFEVDRNAEHAAHMNDLFARLPRPAPDEDSAA